MGDRAPLVLVSNRGPVSFQDDGSVKRGSGGLVTALTGLASHRDAVWIASAMSDGDLRVAEEHGGRPVQGSTPDCRVYPLPFCASVSGAFRLLSTCLMSVV